MTLKRYGKKRDFQKTPEPSPSRRKSLSRTKNNEGHLFVVQEHHARRLHWDFRLELDGVLKSWAVPKGPPLIPGEKHLAVEVEDHPLEYAKFHGTIPKGEYGAGEVAIWDTGEWNTDTDPRTQLKKGHLDFHLKGKRLKGNWLLVRTAMTAKKPSWLLIKRSDETTAVKKTVETPKLRGTDLKNSRTKKLKKKSA